METKNNIQHEVNERKKERNNNETQNSHLSITLGRLKKK